MYSKATAAATVVVAIASLLTLKSCEAVAAPGNDVFFGSGGGISSRCPRPCSCIGSTVDCSHRGLTMVPKGIPLDTERL